MFFGKKLKLRKKLHNHSYHIILLTDIIWGYWAEFSRSNKLLLFI